MLRIRDSGRAIQLGICQQKGIIKTEIK
uniref:Uncharacterized protein n=1 Tax=Rhizophora mucronata TaxID=61149 RepID=A0A2P2IQQ4_RHIMU